MINLPPAALRAYQEKERNENKNGTTRYRIAGGQRYGSSRQSHELQFAIPRCDIPFANIPRLVKCYQINKPLIGPAIGTIQRLNTASLRAFPNETR